jgi:hypothetical protein
MESTYVCECGWPGKNRKKKTGDTTHRDRVAHLRTCTLRVEKAASNQAKRRVADMDIGSTDDAATTMEPPQKNPRLSVSWNLWEYVYFGELKIAEIGRVPT